MYLVYIMNTGYISYSMVWKESYLIFEKLKGMIHDVSSCLLKGNWTIAEDITHPKTFDVMDESIKVLSFNYSNNFLLIFLDAKGSFITKVL